MEDIHRQLKDLEEQHVRSVRELEKLTKGIDHVRAAREELDTLITTGSLNPSLRSLPDQLQSVEEALGEEIIRTRAHILDVELDQDYLRRRLQWEGGDHAVP
jgi:chromosome segregation ATPase